MRQAFYTYKVKEIIMTQNKTLRECLFPFSPCNLPSWAELNAHLNEVDYIARLLSQFEKDPTGRESHFQDLPEVLRREYISNVGFALMNSDLLQELKNTLRFFKCVEVGAGSGALSHCLKHVGVDVQASDSGNMVKWNIQNNFGLDHVGDSVTWLETQKDAEIVIMSWPGYGHAFSNLILNKMRCGQILLYLGEGQGGCTGADDFEDLLDQHTTQDSELLSWGERLNKKFVNWPGIHDYWRFFRKI